MWKGLEYFIDIIPLRVVFSFGCGAKFTCKCKEYVHTGIDV